MRGNRGGRNEQIVAAGEVASHRRPRLFVGELTLTDFRNYARAKLTIDARPVVLVGDNGAGKTNLLEAVSLLGPGHGLRARPYGELVRKDGAGGFAIAAKVTSRLGEVEIGTGFALGAGDEAAGRTVRIAGKEQSAGALVIAEIGELQLLDIEPGTGVAGGLAHRLVNGPLAMSAQGRPHTRIGMST